MKYEHDAIVYDPINRRMFIKGLGGLVLSIPLLETFSTPSFANTTSSDTKRFVGLTVPNQLPYAFISPRAHWRRQVPAEFAAANQNLQDQYGWNYRRVALSEVISQSGRISDLLDSKFNSFSDEITVIRGVGFPGRVDHGRQATFGNTQNSHLGAGRGYGKMATIDEYMADSLRFYKGGRNQMLTDVLRIGEMGISSTGTSTQDDSPMPTYNGNLKLIFDDWVRRSSDGSGGSTPVQDPRKSILDRIVGSLSSVTNNKATSQSDKIRVEQFSDQLRTLASNMESVQNLSCDFSGLNPPDGSIFFWENPFGVVPNGSQLCREYYQAAAQMVSLGIQCNLTQIAMVGPTSSFTSNGSISADHGSAAINWHEAFAHTENHSELLSLSKWHIDNFVYPLIQSLNVEEANTGKTYLQNTCIAYSPENSYEHSGEGLANVLFGNSEALNSGNSFDYGNYDQMTWTHPNQVRPGFSLELGHDLPINRWWVSLMRSMGLTSADYLNKLGNSGNTFGDWTSTYANYGYTQTLGDIARVNRDEPLPGLLKS